METPTWVFMLFLAPGGWVSGYSPLEVEVGALETRITCEPSIVMKRREDHVRILVNRETECVKKGAETERAGRLLRKV